MMPTKYTKAPMILYFHGGGWIGGSTDQFEPMAAIHHRLGMRTRIEDYPVWPDANIQEQMAWVQERVAHRRKWNPLQRIIGIGGSAGGQLVLTATKYLDAVVALNPALNVCEAAEHETFGQPFPFDYDCEKARPGEPQCPVLVMHGTDDDLVPISKAREYRDQHSNLVLLKEIDGAGHGWFNDVIPSVTDEMNWWLGL